MTQQVNPESRNGKLIRGVSFDPDKAMRPRKKRHLDYSSLLHMLQRKQGIGPVKYEFDFDDIEDTISHQGNLSIDQTVFHPGIKFAVVVGIEGDVIQIKGARAAIHNVRAREIFTRDQAEYGFERDYHAGGAKAWRQRQSKWAWLNKWFCKLEGKGAIKRWLEKFDLNRSSMDLLARNFENEALWAQRESDAQESILLDSSNMEQDIPDPTPTSNVIPIPTGYDQQLHEKTSDPANEARNKNLEIETAKRVGIVPTRHPTTLYLQRKHLDPANLGQYHSVENVADKRVKEIMWRHIDEGIAEVIALAPALLRAEVGTAATVETVNVVASPAIEVKLPEITPEDAKIEADIRAALRDDGVKVAIINQIQFKSARGLPFRDQYRHALKQANLRRK